MMMMGIHPIGFTCCLLKNMVAPNSTSLAQSRRRLAFPNFNFSRAVCQRNFLSAHQKDILLYI